MQIKLNRDEVSIDVRLITIIIGSKEFRVSVNNLGELIINKSYFGEDSSSIQIIPRVSNEIELK